VEEIHPDKESPFCVLFREHPKKGLQAAIDFLGPGSVVKLSSSRSGLNVLHGIVMTGKGL